MNKQEELLNNTDQQEKDQLNEKIKELSRQYESGEIDKMDTLVAIRALLTDLT